MVEQAGRGSWVQGRGPMGLGGWFEARFRRLALTLLVLALAPCAVAQGDGDSQGSGAAPAVETPEVPTYEEFATPADTMAHYLDHYTVGWAEQDDEGALLEAMRVFDVSQVPILEQEFIARDAAHKLIQILDRIKRVDPETWREKNQTSWSSGEPWRWIRPYYADPSQSFKLEFARDAGNNWLVSPASTVGLREVWERVLTLDKVPEFRTKRRTVSEWIGDQVPEGLRSKRFLIEDWQWIGLLILVTLSVIIERIVRLVIGRIVTHMAEDERVRVDKPLLLGFQRPLGLLVLAWVLATWIPLLDIAPKVVATIEVGLRFIMAAAGVWSAWRFVDLLCWYLAQRAARSLNTFDDMVVPLVRRTLKIFVALLGIVYVAARLTGDVWGIFAGLGLGSLAVGFAAKDSIENLFGTFTVLMDKPFQLGDWVVIGDVEGTVEEVGFRSTRVRTFYDSLISIPNSRFILSTVDNMGNRRFRRVKAMLTLHMATPVSRVDAFCEAVRELIRKHPHTRKEGFHVYLNQLSDSSYDVLLYCFLRVPDWSAELRERHRLLADILKVAEELDVQFAYPTRTVEWVQSEAPGVPSGHDEDSSASQTRGRGAAHAVLGTDES